VGGIVIALSADGQLLALLDKDEQTAMPSQASIDREESIKKIVQAIAKHRLNREVQPTPADLMRKDDFRKVCRRR
jgi:Zn-dependent M32 family carboxypeptidase